MQEARLTLGPARLDRRRAVRITDQPVRVTYTVVPTRIDGRPRVACLKIEPAPSFAATMARHGYLDADRATDATAYIDPPFLDLGYLAVVALAYLDSHSDANVFTSERRKGYGIVVQRPDNARLLSVLRDAVNADISMRHALHYSFGASLKTADDWIEYARALPGADLPAARRGRPPGRKNINTTRKVD